MRNHSSPVRAVLRGCAALSLLLAAACGDILSLKQSNPGQVDASTLYVPTNAQLLVNGAIADFECAFSRYVTGTALLSDELANAFANTNNHDYDRRTVAPTSPYAGGCGSGAQLPGFYTGLSTARGDADTVYARFEGWTDAEVPTRQRLMAQLAVYGGYSLVLLGESMCGAAINVGPEMTPAQLFAEAKLRFDKAETHATAANDATLLNFARLGRARSLVNLHAAASPNATALAAAAADAAQVTSGFVLNISTDAVNTRRQNLVFVHTSQSSFGTVDPSFRNLTLGGNPDPRVLVTNTGRVGTAASTPIWTPNKYPAITTVMPVAKYAEAQLIVAEERAAANDLTGAASAINNARNTRAGMPQYSSAGQTQAQVQAQIVEERRRELFLEGHRLWDIQRFGLALVPGPGTTYVQGGGTYEDQKCFPLPAVERNNNPNIPKIP